MTHTEPRPLDDPDPMPDGRPRFTIGLVFIVLAFVVFVVFWVWALFFASKESINRIEDRAWTERSQQICAAANLERDELADFRRIDPDDLAMLRDRGDLIDSSTDVIESMLDDVTAVAPSDAKGAEIVPLWVSDYRTLVGNRRAYADLTRAGANEPFREAELEGVPISERITRFAIDNDMPGCVAPRDL